MEDFHDDDSFRERTEESSEGEIIYQQPSIPRTAIEIDRKLDLPTLDLESFIPTEMIARDITNKLTGFPSAITITVGGNELEQWDQSIQALLQREQSKQLQAYLEEAQRLINEKEYREALGPLGKVLASDANSVPVLFLQSYCFFCLQDYEQSYALLLQARAHLDEQDKSMLLLIVQLEQACTSAIIRAVQARVEEFLAQKQYDQALTLVESELAQHPTNPLLLYDRFGLLLLLQGFAEARDIARTSISSVSHEEAGHFRDLLIALDRQEAHQRMEIARQEIRKGDLDAANQKLESCREVLGDQEYYEAICHYVAERRRPRQLHRARGVFGLFKGNSVKPKDSLQEVLTWLLSDELTEAITALQQENFTEARYVLAVTDTLDPRCELVAYLHSLAAYQGLERLMADNAHTEDFDLEYVRDLLDLATNKLSQETSNPQLMSPWQDLQAAIQRNSAEVRVALCLQNFKTMRDHYRAHPIDPSDSQARATVQEQVSRQLLAVAEAQSKQPHTAQLVEILDLLEKRLKTLEKHLK